MELTNSESIVGQLSEEEQSRLKYHSQQEGKQLLTKEEFAENKIKFNKGLNKFQKFTEEFYNKNPIKEIYDALISLNSIKNL